MTSLNASFDLRPVPASVPTARHVVVQMLRSWRVPHDLDDAALLVTELVSNVVDHVGGEASLTVELSVSGDWLRIAVVDGSAIRPVVQELSLDRPPRLAEQVADHRREQGVVGSGVPDEPLVGLEGECPAEGVGALGEGDVVAELGEPDGRREAPEAATDHHDPRHGPTL